MIVIKEKIEVIPVIAGEIQGWLEKNKLFIILDNLLLCKIANCEVIHREGFPRPGKSRDLCTFEYLFTSCTVEGREKWGLFYLGKPLHWSKESDFGREKSEIWERLMDCSLPQGNSPQIIDSSSR